MKAFPPDSCANMSSIFGSEYVSNLDAWLTMTL